MADNDFVERLRIRWEAMGDTANDERAAAAAEIERLREEAERLRAERDEARRRVCEDAIRNGRVYRRVGSDTVRCETSKEVAEMMGWDCYKENKENTND